MTPDVTFIARAAGLAVTIVVAAAMTSGAQSPFQDTIRNLRHPNVETRLDAVERLAAAAHTPAAEAVAPLALDPDDRVQAAAIEAELSFFLVERIGSMRVLGIGDSRSRAQQAFELGALARSAAVAPPLVTDRLLAAMRDENARVQFDAVHALGFLVDAPVDDAFARALAAELEHYDPVMRAATARVLGQLGAAVAAEPLRDALTDSSSVVRLQAIEALGRIRDREALSALRRMLPDARGDLSAAIVLAIARIGSVDDRTLLRVRLADRSAPIRRAAAEGLGRIGDRESRQSIADLFASDRDERVRLAAAFALETFGEHQAHAIAARVSRDTVAEGRDYLLELGGPALPGLLAALKESRDARHRADLLHLVGWIGSAADVDILAPYRTDRDERVSRAAVNAVARIERGQRPEDRGQR